MTASLATAAKRPADAARPPAWRPPARAEAAPPVRLQRCACGGGCPRCRAAHAGLSVSRPGDADEVAAERMAGAALAAPVPLHRAAAGAPAGVEATLPPALDGLRGGGRPLSDSVRAELEPRFGADFGAVRVHADAPAAALAEEHGAQAFTVGRDIAFGAGRYAPETAGGRALLAHELAHVAQQRGPADGARLQAKVVDDDEHFPCRTTPDRPGRLTAVEMAAREESAASRAATAAAAIRATPITEDARRLLWKHFRLDYNDPMVRCRQVATVADRLESLADAIRNQEITYHCSVTGQPAGQCTVSPANAWTTVGITRRMDLCDGFWGRGADAEAQTLLHEWSHYEFVRRGLGDESDQPFDNAPCYAGFAFEITGVPGVVRSDLCLPNTAPLPARDETRISAPCPTNVFASLPLTGGALLGLPGGPYGTVSTGWDLLFPLTRMHDWEASLGPRLTVGIPGGGGERPPLAYLLGVRAGLQFRYRPWRFGYNVGGYVEGGGALLPPAPAAPGTGGAPGASSVSPYGIGGITAGLNIPMNRDTMFRIFLDVGAGAGLNTSDHTTFGLFQAGLGVGFEFRGP